MGCITSKVLGIAAASLVWTRMLTPDRTDLISASTYTEASVKQDTMIELTTDHSP